MAGCCELTRFEIEAFLIHKSHRDPLDVVVQILKLCNPGFVGEFDRKQGRVQKAEQDRPQSDQAVQYWGVQPPVRPCPELGRNSDYCRGIILTHTGAGTLITIPVDCRRPAAGSIRKTTSVSES